jgi:hypothetical protein
MSLNAQPFRDTAGGVFWRADDSGNAVESGVCAGQPVDK